MSRATRVHEIHVNNWQKYEFRIIERVINTVLSERKKSVADL